MEATTYDRHPKQHPKQVSRRGFGESGRFAPNPARFAPRSCDQEGPTPGGFASSRLLPSARRLPRRGLARRRVRLSPHAASVRSAPSAMRPSSNMTSEVIMRWSPKMVDRDGNGPSPPHDSRMRDLRLIRVSSSTSAVSSRPRPRGQPVEWVRESSTLVRHCARHLEPSPASRPVASL
jgi:hypothetical protein